MRIRILNFIFGTVKLKAQGIFPERIINIANQMGIFIQNIHRDDEDSITFLISSEGFKRLTASSLPSDITLSKLSSFGIPSLINNSRGRILLLLCPFIIFILLFLSTQFIWTVNIIDADSETEERLLTHLKELGVKRGALKFSIDPSEVKDKLLIKDDSLLWIWVDIKGASAIVRFANRSMPPSVLNYDEAYNVYSTKEGIVTRIIPKSGTPLVSVGDTITQGQLLIEGVIAKNAEETKPVHATGEVFASVWEEKTVTIPKKKEIRTPTGEKSQRLSVIFFNFPIKLFINSRILYTNCDIIVSSRTLSFIPVTFKKEEYVEVEVTYEDNSMDLLTTSLMDEFKKELSNKGFTVKYTESYMEDKGDYSLLTLRVLCEEMIATERRIQIGENYSVSDS